MQKVLCDGSYEKTNKSVFLNIGVISDTNNTESTTKLHKNL